jgi:hypothetical protein
MEDIKTFYKSLAEKGKSRDSVSNIGVALQVGLKYVQDNFISYIVSRREKVKSTTFISTLLPHENCEIVQFLKFIKGYLKK